MHGTSARHAQDEVLIGAAFGSAGRPSGVSWREGVGMNRVPEDLVQRWEAVYGLYLSAPAGRAEPARLSAEVASAWRDIAAVPGLAWWVVAGLRTAAEAFERQAARWSGARHELPGRPTEREGEPGTWCRSLDSED